MTGIVLAGVHSWGEGVLENVACRPLLPIASRPLIRHAVDWLGLSGISEAYVCANSHTRILRRCLGDGLGPDVSLKYYEDQMPRGPAGCARDAAILGGGRIFVVVEGTIVPRIELRDLLDAHVESKAALTVAVAGSENASAGVNSPLEPVGIYVFSRELLPHIPPTGYQDIKETLIPCLHAKGLRVVPHVVRGDLAPRVSGAESYLAVNHWAVRTMPEDAARQDGYVRVGEAWVHESARVDPTARLVGPVLIGPDCVVGPGAMMVGPTTIGRGGLIGNQVVISRSALWDGCTVESGAVLDQCIVIDRTTVESEVVARSTVFVPRRRWSRGFLNRLAVLCGIVRERARIVGGDDRRPSGAGPDPAVEFPRLHAGRSEPD